MWARVLVITAFCFVVALAATSKSSRPNPCPVGSSYKKDCNTCQCGSSPRDDKCSQLNCARLNAGSATTARTPTGKRPGTCPTIVTPAPGSDSCSKRAPSSSNCVKDTDCPGAKKCCKDGCSRQLCRNAIYNQTQIQAG